MRARLGKYRRSAFGALMLAPLTPDQKTILCNLLQFERPLPAKGFDAAALRALLPIVKVHRLLGVLEFVLSRMTDEQRRELQRDIDDLHVSFGENRRHIDAAHQEFAALQSLLRGAGLRCIALKGIVLGGRYYPDRAMRPMSDVDVLIAPEECDAVLRLLHTSGYGERPGQELHGPSTALHFPQLVHRERGVVVEVHTSLARGLDLNGIARHYDVGNASDENPLDPAIHIAHRLLDIAKDGYFRPGLLGYLDLLLLLGRHGEELDWRRLARLLDDVGLREHAAATLLAMQRSLPLDMVARIPRPAAHVDSHLLNLAIRYFGRSDAFWRCRYTPRWQRRVTRWLVGTVA
jgi:hypothetical protein